jgi:hypothetical protein
MAHANCINSQSIAQYNSIYSPSYLLSWLVECVTASLQIILIYPIQFCCQQHSLALSATNILTI